MEAFVSLQSMSIKSLKLEATRLNVNLSGCFEKCEIIAKLQEATGLHKAGPISEL